MPSRKAHLRVMKLHTADRKKLLGSVNAEDKNRQNRLKTFNLAYYAVPRLQILCGGDKAVHVKVLTLLFYNS